jgi:Zinc carboxypeptidase
MKRNRLKGIVTLVWIVNLAVCLLVAGLFAWFRMPTRAEAISPISLQQPTNYDPDSHAEPSITPVPTPIRKPTITPWPTPMPGPSVTPMMMPVGNRIVIGYSIEKRPQEVYRFGQGPVNKFILAGIHGGSEWNTVELADQLIAYLNDHPDRVPADTSLYILEDMNPDGTARDHGVDGRVNDNGVDLNHNWPYNWKAVWSRDGCWNYRPDNGGAYAGSEPEVQNLISFLDKIKPIALISYHSAALGIFPGGKPDFGPSIRLASALAAVSNYPYPPIDTGCDYSGNLTDWAANTRGIASVDIELSNHVDTDFDQNLRVLQAFLDWYR